ncbi:unnamed protein product [Effrenium voratum]|nr:unnamed protein product [Effrenium voratum]
MTRYYFGTGEEGLGYYRDLRQRRPDRPVKPPEPVPPAGPLVEEVEPRYAELPAYAARYLEEVDALSMRLPAEEAEVVKEEPSLEYRLGRQNLLLRIALGEEDAADLRLSLVGRRLMISFCSRPAQGVESQHESEWVSLCVGRFLAAMFRKLVTLVSLAAVHGEPSEAELMQEPRQGGQFVELTMLQQAVAEQQRTILDQKAELEEYMDHSRRLQVSVNETYYSNTIASLQATDYGFTGAIDSAWLCLCGALVMFMHAGFAMLETGSCRAKNASNVLMKNLVNVCVGTLGWWSLGWAFAYGAEAKTNGFIGASGFFGLDFYTQDATTGVITPVTCNSDGCQSTMLSWFFQWAFCTAGATIVSGGVAERVKSPTYAAYAFCMTTFIYPVIVAWSWGGGWLNSIFDVGYMDFAGSGIVHLTGGVSALAGTVVLGPRKGRFVNPEEFEAHNLPLVVLGTFALWFGWYGFNPGSTLSMSSGNMGALAAQVAMNTTLSAATGGIMVFLARYAIFGKYDVGGLCNGILAGLVSITAGCGNMESGCAVATGFVGALVYQGSSMLLQKLKIDDPVDAVPVHGFCGIWGVLAASLFDWGSGINYYHGWRRMGLHGEP